MGLKVVRGGYVSGKVAARSGGGRRKRPGGMPEVALADWTGTTLRDSPWVVRWERRAPTAPSGWKGNGSQSGEGATELVLPGPALGKVQGQAAGLAGEPSGQGEEASPEGLGGHDLLTEPDARRPAGQIVSDDPVSSTGQAPGRPARRRWRGSAPRGDG